MPNPPRDAHHPPFTWAFACEPRKRGKRWGCICNSSFSSFFFCFLSCSSVSPVVRVGEGGGGQAGVAFGASCQPEETPHCTWVAIKTGTVLHGGIQIHEIRHNLLTTLDIKIASD